MYRVSGFDELYSTGFFDSRAGRRALYRVERKHRGRCPPA
ncbi:MAG: hypothetical protein ACLVL7_12560 [Anaerotruncus massiliensis (ex Togo et al. 2019)]